MAVLFTLGMASSVMRGVQEGRGCRGGGDKALLGDSKYGAIEVVRDPSQVYYPHLGGGRIRSGCYKFSSLN